MESWTAFKRKMWSSAQSTAAVYKPSIVCEFWKIAAPSLPLWASVAGMVGGGERSSYRHTLTQQSSQGSPGQIKHTRESRYYVESGSSIESNVNKSIECVAIRFIQHRVAKALKRHLDASDTEVSTCRNAVYWRTLKPCNLAVTVQKETLLDFHPAFIITMWAGYANQQC